MNLSLRDDFIRLWGRYFPGEPLPITFEFSSELRGLDPPGPSDKWKCLVCDLTKVRNGKNLVLDASSVTCKGGQRYCGYGAGEIPNFNYFLSYGLEGKTEGERYKKSPEVVNEWMKDYEPLPSTDKKLIFKRWDNLTEKDNPVAVIFFAHGEVLSGLFTLANFDRRDPFGVITPMGAGCSSLIYYPWHEEQSDDPRAVLGMMDPSARPCVQMDMLSFAVPMKKFTGMVQDMEESFLTTPAWDRVRAKIEQGHELHKK